MPVVVDEKQSLTIGFWTPLRLALFFWLSMVAATVVPLLLIVERSRLAIATVGVAVVVGAVLFAFVRAEAELRAEIDRTSEILRDNLSVTPSERRR